MSYGGTPLPRAGILGDLWLSDPALPPRQTLLGGPDVAGIGVLQMPGPARPAPVLGAPAPQQAPNRLADAFNFAMHGRDAEKAAVGSLIAGVERDGPRAAQMIGDVGDVLGYAGDASEIGSELVRGYRNVRAGMPVDDAIANGLGRFGTDFLARQTGKLGGGALGGLVTENPVGGALGAVLGEGAGSALADQMGVTDAGGAATLRGWRALKADIDADPRVLQAWQQMLYRYPGP